MLRRRSRLSSLRHGNPAKTLARQGFIWYGDGHIALDLEVRGGRQCYGTEMEMCPIPAGPFPPFGDASRGGVGPPPSPF